VVLAPLMSVVVFLEEVIEYPEEEKHTKLPEELIKIKIKNSIEENGALRDVRNHIVEEEVVVNFE
jgi:hypothetical protein